MSRSARRSSHSHRNLSRRRQLDQQHKLRMRRRLWQPEALEARQLMAGDVTGTVFNDLNVNGLDDAGDVGLAGWTVYVDVNGNGALDSGERLTAPTRNPAASLRMQPAPCSG